MAEGLEVIQSMIDISADRLERLRTECATSAELTQQETRSLESKLVRMFCELLLTRQNMPDGIYVPTTNDDLRQWLRVVGLSKQTINAVIQHVNTLETLLAMNEDEICAILTNNQTVQTEESRRFMCANNTLKRCQQCIKSGTEPSDMFWDSWDRRHNIRLSSSSRISNNRLTTVIVSDQNNHDELIQSPTELSPPETQNSTSSLMTSGTLTSSSDKLLNMISPEEGSGVSNLSPSPSPPQSPSVYNTTSQSSSGSNNKRHAKGLYNSINNNNLRFNGSNKDMSSSITSIGSSTTTSNNLNNNDIEIELSTDQGMDSMSKSKSNESQLSVNGQKYCYNGSIMSGSEMSSESVPIPAPRTRYPITNQQDFSDSIHGEYPIVTPIIVSDTSAPPRSPCTPVRVMAHMIQHRFEKKFKFKFKTSTCDLCLKQMFFGFKCTECKYRCHKDCKSNVPPSCGLPKELVDEFKKTLHSESLMPSASPNLPRSGLMPNKRRDVYRPPVHSIHGADSSSAGSSCNSSSPSSPALLTIPPQTPANKSQFNFPEVSSASVTNQNHQNSHHNSNFMPNTIIEDAEFEHTHSKGGEVHLRNNFTNNYQHSLNSMIHSEMGGLQTRLNGSIIDSNGELTDMTFVFEAFSYFHPPTDSLGTIQSNESDKTMSTGDSDRMTPRLESVEERDSNMWPRQNSLSLKEWDIPYDDLNLGAMIGRGRFGTVFRGNWHGDVAVKILKKDFLDDEHAIEAFKLEVAIFKNTRHENLVLFMGACMKPPRLAIVTSMCKGNTLYTHIHLRRDKFNLNKTTLIAQQIAQGMGYLHRRGIVHKDLKSKNIFLENEKVIITDFGLFSVTKLVYDCDKGLAIPSGWLCYLAPELIRNLKPYRPTNEDLPFTKAADAYAFGAIWYELLCGEFPFKTQPESVIWQVGRGMKQSLANLQASRDVKDILMMCWSFQADDRPDFNQLFTTLERLPKKRLARSPSHPIQLSRSAESVF